LAKTNASGSLSYIFARCGRTISPLLDKKTRSTGGAEWAGATRIRSNASDPKIGVSER